MQNMHKQNLLTTLMKTGAEQVSGEQIFPTLFIWPLYYLLCVSQHFCTIPYDNMLLPLSKIRPLFTNISPGLVIGVLQYLFGLENMYNKENNA